MLGYWTEAEQRPDPAQRTPQGYFAEHPVIPRINMAAAQLGEILGPVFWAALIIGFLWAELVAT